MSGAAELRVLAARALAEKPTYALECEIRKAIAPRSPTVPRPYLGSVDWAATVMPRGWTVSVVRHADDECTASACHVDHSDERASDATEARVRTALGLRCRAAEMEAKP